MIFDELVFQTEISCDEFWKLSSANDFQKHFCRFGTSGIFLDEMIDDFVDDISRDLPTVLFQMNSVTNPLPNLGPENKFNFDFYDLNSDLKFDLNLRLNFHYY